MIEINNLTRKKIDGKFLKEVVKKILREEKNNLDISIALVNPSEIKNLNKKYRKKDKPTDVLSFTYKDSLGRSPAGKAGEIVICPQIIKENAERFGESFKKEMARVLIHGILHILGYDHKKDGAKVKKMIKKQEYYNSSAARNI
ncbi:MAG: rRNA maturation RNase YbeY [Patescibacteria group bacterium]